MCVSAPRGAPFNSWTHTFCVSSGFIDLLPTDEICSVFYFHSGTLKADAWYKNDLYSALNNVYSSPSSSSPPPSLFNSVNVTHFRKSVALRARLSSSYYLQSVLYLFTSPSLSVALGWKPLLYLTAVWMCWRPLPSCWDCCSTNGAVITSRMKLRCTFSANKYFPIWNHIITFCLENNSGNLYSFLSHSIKHI